MQVVLRKTQYSWETNLQAILLHPTLWGLSIILLQSFLTASYTPNAILHIAGHSPVHHISDFLSCSAALRCQRQCLSLDTSNTNIQSLKSNVLHLYLLLIKILKRKCWSLEEKNHTVYILLAVSLIQFVLKFFTIHLNSFNFQKTTNNTIEPWP